MTIKSLNIAVIGCGNIGKRHLAVIDAEERASLVAVCDIDEQKTQELAKLYGNVPFYNNLDDMLSKESIDLIIVSTPHDTHANITIEALKNGCHVLVEKPMTLSVADGNKMIECAKNNGKKLFVVKQNRYNVPIKLVEEAFKQNRLGKVFMVNCNVFWNRHEDYYAKSNWRGKKNREGGALYTQASHFIDLLINWFGDIKSTKTYIDTKKQAIEIEDTGSSIIQFESGVLCNLNWTTTVYSKNYEGSITLIAEKGTIKIGGKYLNKIDYWDVESFPLQEGVEFSDKPNIYSKYQGTSSNHHLVLQNVIGNILNEEKNIVVGGHEGLRTVMAIEKIYNGTTH